MLGQAGQIPLADDSVDMVFMSQVYHHIPYPSRALHEIKRVLRPGGHFVNRAATAESSAAAEWIKFFPEAGLLDKRRMAPKAAIIEEGIANGFDLVSAQEVATVFAASYREYYDKISNRGLSALIEIDDRTFEQGLLRLKEFSNQQPPDRPVIETMSLLIFRATLAAFQYRLG